MFLIPAKSKQPRALVVCFSALIIGKGSQPYKS